MLFVRRITELAALHKNHRQYVLLDSRVILVALQNNNRALEHSRGSIESALMRIDRMKPAVDIIDCDSNKGQNLKMQTFLKGPL